ncbi:uncharacterized protein MELLADRAFT_79114 [Melampsora larici-populina 98AG31]|uniref:Uncharacterized protein n=1 Tax=Melampsora larici-populina (strain 98AG31 / pathotype 3-4-7) TaxID=747676 RepID=F4S311_MELLP|nr:uncharacterized protein MELLADRAFT_79114 [Melampsora larici-populina 98AG31]EGG00984.1 hypothetical protein MELLADRAFT_79114 [Melampsora larici-populina 98AG31]
MITKREKMGSRARSDSHLFTSTLPTNLSATARRHPKRYCDLRPASQLLLHSLVIKDAPSEPSIVTKSKRTTASFQVFCDSPTSDSQPNPAKQRSTQLKEATPTVYLPLQPKAEAPNAMLGDKENAVPEFDQILLPLKRPFARPKLNSILTEKKPVLKSTIGKDRWGGKTPFAPCSPIVPSRMIHQHSLPKNRRTQPSTRGSLLDTTLFCPTATSSASSSSSSSPITLDDLRPEPIQEVISLVSQLEVDLTKQDDDEHEMLDPLPVDTVCPGAPKALSTITLPDFDYGNDDDVKSPVSHQHQMSPLAEVTEAYTGLQGGWSPPVETWSPILTDLDDSFPPLFFQSSEAPVKKEDVQVPESIIISPRLKRRREVLLGIDTTKINPSSTMRKTSMRI